MKNIRIVIITGLSGSGKSTAIKALEDVGFFCIDNLPPSFLPKFIELCHGSAWEITKIALVMDIREREFLKEYPQIFSQLKELGHKIEIAFLESSDEVLINRFSETRRQHPLSPETSVLEGIKLERKALSDLRNMAERIIDTSNFNPHQLRDVIFRYFSEVSPLKKMTINLISFGFRFGIPYDADTLMDVRFLPSPYFVQELKDLNGDSEKVRDFVLARKETKRFLEKFVDLMNLLIPLYEKEGKTYLTVAIGCTGGRHRSVTIVNYLRESLNSDKYFLRVMHRDVAKS